MQIWVVKCPTVSLVWIYLLRGDAIGKGEGGVFVNGFCNPHPHANMPEGIQHMLKVKQEDRNRKAGGTKPQTQVSGCLLSRLMCRERAEAVAIFAVSP